jgi:UDP-N-acetylglucosamine 2-epimerase (non-hydrolysing)
MQIACVIGTRPEAIRISPVVHGLRRPGSTMRALIVNSGQHRPEVASILAELGLGADETLPDCRGQSLTTMTASLLDNVGASNVLAAADVVLVQGDTTTAFAAGMAAFHRRLPLAHLGAGLRSGSLDMPFPEEGHRKLLAMVATLHFAPTAQARANLRAMGVAATDIAVTGNTCVDVLRTYGARSRASARASLSLNGLRMVLVTLHRRESWHGPLAGVCDAIAATVRDHDAFVVFPMHPNPRVREVVSSRLAGTPRVRLLDALPYQDFVTYLHAADVVMTDSGGVQEESATLGKQTLVVRSVTDRPEAVDAGIAELVGTGAAEVSHALAAALQRQTTDTFTDVYGDGAAAARVVLALQRWRDGERPLLPRELEFRSFTMRDALAAS